VFSSVNWFEGSQVSKARPGAPIVSPYDIAEGTSLVISLRTRFSESAPRDDKEGATVCDRSADMQKTGKERKSHMSKKVSSGIPIACQIS
jgi:hypothetical protein